MDTKKRREHLKAVFLGDNGTGKTMQMGALVRACPDYAPLALLAVEHGSETLQEQVDDGSVVVFPCESPEKAKAIMKALQGWVVVRDGRPLPAREGQEGAVLFRSVGIDSLSKLAKRVIEEEKDLEGGDVGPEGRKRRKNYGANQYRDWNGEARKRLEVIFVQSEELVSRGCAVMISCEPKAIWDQKKDGYADKLQPALPGGPQAGAMSQMLRGWARYQWWLYADADQYYALTQQLHSRQASDERLAWARPFGRYPKTSLPRALYPARRGLLPQVYPAPDFGEFWKARRAALGLVARGEDPGTIEFLEELKEAGHRVFLPKKKEDEAEG